MSEIDSQMNRLAEGMAYLEDRLGVMNARLGPVLCEPPAQKADCAPREITGSVLGQQIQTQAERAFAAAARIDYLLSCLRI